MSLRCSAYTLQRFIPATQGISDQTESNPCPLNGDEISSFYEDVVNSEASSNTRVKVNKKPSPNSSRGSIPTAEVSNSTHPDVNHFLLCAQTDDISGLEHCLQQGIDINVKDHFGWSALMCAACSGASLAVKYLLDHNADQRIHDKTGLTAWKLAHRKGHSGIIDLLLSQRRYQPLNVKIKIEKQPDPVEDTPPVPFVCEICKETINEVSKERHQTSLLHQFNRSKAGLSSGFTQYHIPENNVGFQLMLKDGWNRELGLGPAGSGVKYPPKTVLKRDRQGFGSEAKQKAKITHFGPKDTNAVKYHKIPTPKQSTTNRHERLLNERRARRKEMEFRREWHSLD